MDYRDERDALRARVEHLERQAGEATARADRAETELAQARAALNQREAELRDLRRGGMPTPPTRASSTGLVLGVVAAVILGSLVVCGGAGWVFYRRAAPPAPAVAVGDAPSPADTSPPSDPVVKGGVGKGGVVPAGEHLQWGWGSGPSAMPAAADGGGEDLIGAYRVLDLGTSKAPLYVGRFDGKTFRRIWAAGPYGTLSDMGYGFTVAGRVLVTDFRSKAHVLDAATGKELHVLTMTDRAREICPLRDRAAAWVQVADKQDVEIDLETFAMKPGGKPTSCTGDFARTTCQFARALCEQGGAPAEGAAAVITLKSGDDAVTVGKKTPGTASLLAYAAGGKGWKTSIAEDDALAKPASFDLPGADLAAGRLVIAYELVHDGFRLASFDAKSGKRQWDVAIPRSAEGSGPRGITASATRVYVPHWTWLDVFDIATGNVLGTIGIW
jgi:hypothetical protein